MAKGIAVATGIVIAGLLGAVLFVSTVPPALMNFLGEGTGAQENADFDEFLTGMEDVCNEEKQSVTGGMSLYDGTISFERISSGTKTILVKNNQQQAAREIDCQVENADMEITGTTGYTISKDDDILIIEKDQISGGEG